MNFHILTLFPDMVLDGLHTSIIGRAVENGLISIEAIDIREYSTDKHRHVDDYPYGGGAGMVMQPMPICDAYDDLCDRIGKKPRVIYLTPQGTVFSQKIAEELAAEEELVFLCGHYEGVDERALELVATDYLSIGDYVLTGGELGAMVISDAVARMIPGVLGDAGSAATDSFYEPILEYPQYTKPADYNGWKVPEVLLSGHHANIARWRRKEALRRTLECRPDLLSGLKMTAEDKKLLAEIKREKEDQ